MDSSTDAPALPLRRILRTWWPLAASWLMMTSELPLISAVIARLAAPEINLAAWGVVFAMSAIIQSPSTMLLAASTTLSKDWESYRRLRRYMLLIGVVLTTLHILIAFTPLYFFVAQTIMGIPDQLLAPTRLGLMLMAPWSWGTAYRRFQQGVLIRFDRAQVVIWGSLIRVGMDSAVLAIGYWLGDVAGIAVGASAIIAGVVSEAIYTRIRVQPVLNGPLRAATAATPALTLSRFLKFYVPLALTMLFMLVVQPMVSAALSRMPQPLESLAVWPVVFGFLIMWQSVGIGYNEAVIALLEEAGAVRSLRRFSFALAGLLTVLLLIVTASPLAALWFKNVAALGPRLLPLAEQALWVGLLLPGLRVLQSWYQGAITYGQQTQGITEAVVVYLVTISAILWGGVVWQQMTGLYVGMAAFVAGFLLQTIWLGYRSRGVLRQVQHRDTVAPGPLQNVASAR